MVANLIIKRKRRKEAMGMLFFFSLLFLSLIAVNDEWDISLLETLISSCGDLFKSYNFNP